MQSISLVVRRNECGIDPSAQAISISYQTCMLHALLDRHYIAVSTSGKLLLGMGRDKSELARIASGQNAGRYFDVRRHLSSQRKERLIVRSALVSYLLVQSGG